MTFKRPPERLIYCGSCGQKKPVSEFRVEGYRIKRSCKACEASKVKQ